MTRLLLIPAGLALLYAFAEVLFHFTPVSGWMFG